MNSTCRSAVQPSARRLSGTGVKAGMYAGRLREAGVIGEVKADLRRVGKWFRRCPENTGSALQPSGFSQPSHRRAGDRDLEAIRQAQPHRAGRSRDLRDRGPGDPPAAVRPHSFDIA